MENYLKNRYKPDLIQILEQEDENKHYTVNINFVELFEYDTQLGNNILNNSDQALEEFNKLIESVQDSVLRENNDGVRKKYIHARIFGLPACPELHRTVLPKNDDISLFLQVTGTVIRVTEAKVLEYKRIYKCNKCKHVHTVYGMYDQKYSLNPPSMCNNPQKCPGNSFTKINSLEAEYCKDYQEIKIQEQVSKLSVGAMPNTMWVTLEDDLVDSCKPGDDVTICGTVKRRWDSLSMGKPMNVELVIKANYVHVNNSQNVPGLITPAIKEQFLTFWDEHRKDPFEGRNFILQSFCPQLYGLFLVKLAVGMVLAGGTRTKAANFRSEPHLLLVGDPGTGKSQLLKFASKVISRSVFTTGIGSTSAGLTVTAVMESGHWQLEAGALVLADGGICCIDEFNSMKEHDKASIHEAMEQQTISVAKASIVCKLSTRCSILAATNPKGGKLDPTQTSNVNLALSSPLLSRFDLILMLRDTVNIEWDTAVTDYILNGQSNLLNKTMVDGWNIETLQLYFSVVRTLQPVLTDNTTRILSTYYQAQRRAISRNKARTTIRLLDSLIRLSQGHAKLMFHTRVEVMDAIFTLILVESSMEGGSILGLEIDSVQTPFPDNTMKWYSTLMQRILEKLQLNDILEEELKNIKENYNVDGPNVSNIEESKDDTETIHLEKPEENQQIGDFKAPEGNQEIIIDQVINQKPSNSEAINNILNETENKFKIPEGIKRKPKDTPNKNRKKRALNNSELLNLIPSFNDNLQEVEEILDDKCDMKREVIAQKIDEFVFKKPDLHFENEQSTSEKKGNEKPDLEKNQNVSENQANEPKKSKLDTFRFKFSFRPRKQSDENSDNKEETPVSLFESQPKDLENLDLDF